jgi:hypothetical protein
MAGSDAVFQGVFGHVASLCYSCFICMFQLFCTDVIKVDRDVAYIVMVVHVCCKRMFPIFHENICFSNIRCKCVYLDIAYVLHVCSKCFI